MITQKKVIFGIAGIAGTIFLGAIGSGLWERCFSKLLDAIVNVSVRTMSSLFSTYKSSIYIEAAKGFHESSSLFLQILVLALLPVVYLRLLWRHPYKKKEQKPEHIGNFVRSREGYYALTGLTVAVFISFTLNLTRVSYVNRVTTFAHQSLSIIAPNISDEALKKLWADYHSMRKEEDFAVFRQNVESIAKENGVKLPDFKGL